MRSFDTIEIDFDVQKAIWAELQDSQDTANAVLRRKFGLGASDTPAPTTPQRPGPTPSATGRAWVGSGRSRGLTLPHGTELQINYNTQQIVGRIEDGALVFEGRRFKSPSGAADSLCRTKDGRRTSLNGKELMHARLPGETKWVLIKELYEQAEQDEQDAA